MRRIILRSFDKALGGPEAWKTYCYQQGIYHYAPDTAPTYLLAGYIA